jgi:hypothetical protein
MSIETHSYVTMAAAYRPDIVTLTSTQAVRQPAAPRTALSGNHPSASPTTMRLRRLLALHGGLRTPAVRALIREAIAPIGTSAGNRHDTLKAVAAHLVHAGWSDADIHALVQPSVVEHWGGNRIEPLSRILAWLRGQEAVAQSNAPAASASATALARAFGANRGAK